MRNAQGLLAAGLMMMAASGLPSEGSGSFATGSRSNLWSNRGDPPRSSMKGHKAKVRAKDKAARKARRLNRKPK